MKKFLTFMLMFVAAFVLVACDEEETPDPTPDHTHNFVDGECACGEKDSSVIGPTDILPEAITINQPETTSVVAGDSVELKVVYTPSNTNQKALTWTSSDGQIATVDKGIVTFIGAGSVTITATSEKVDTVKSSITFTVVLPKLESIEIKGSNKLVNRDGSHIQLTVAATPKNADASVTWSISDESVAKIDENGVVIAVAVGTATVTATSKVNEEISADFEIEVTKDPTLDQNTEVTEVTVEGTDTLYFGYSARLTANVYPLTANQSVTWESSNNTIIDVDDDGYIEALSVGSARVRAISVANPEIASSWHRIQVIEDEDSGTVVDMQGYKIVIMQASSAIADIDPHEDLYKGSDRQAKKKAWDDVEEKYNCDLAVEAYPDTATWGTPRRTYITDNATNGNVPADIYTISSAWLAGFVDADAALDVSEYYEKYGKGQMEPGQLGAGTIQGGLYIVSTGTSKTTNYVDHGLYYNIDELEKYGVEDPATMFNEGRWTYTNFEIWARELQSSLPEGSYAIGGHPYYYWLGMTAAAGIKITDYQTLAINIESSQSEEGMKLLNRLVTAGAMNPTADWAEGGGDDGFQHKTTLMTSGRFWFIYSDNRWAKGMWEEGAYPNIGYVPYPYPDDMNKEDTRITTTGGTVYMYAKGRTYGDGFGAEEVYKVVNEMYLNTIIIQKTQPTFDAEEELRTSLSTKLGNDASIEAAMFFTARRVMFDPTETVYASTATSVFNSVTKDIVYNGTDYQNAVAAVKDSFQQTVLDQLG